MKLQALICPQCGAPLTAGDLNCPCCHCQLSSLACPHCFAFAPKEAKFCPSCGFSLQIPSAESEDPSPLHCPACRTQLNRRNLDQHRLHICPGCGGLWLDPKQLHQIEKEAQARKPWVDPTPTTVPQIPDEVHYRPCPVCGTFMNRVNYGKTSGVVLDVCKEHGSWFDAHELQRVAEFVREGGLDRRPEDQEAALKQQFQLAFQANPQLQFEPEASNRGLELIGLVAKMLRGLG